ncbi:PAS domain-containing protein [Flagellimonas allohymeniacidonis]|uniref:histidine kinase n=1 Tax=Flagellimonas allohymeniacidonis TaxID=2517819 RepID=A0A4Q8QI93_9FLAO|nr:PAS domain-containing protein [Allomuricauda hymeniacidonis]TAI48413.1 PAS domain S-box protein [Allomuricauda hymeniacidonis]
MTSQQYFQKQKTSRSALFESDRKLRTLVANLPGIVYRYKNDEDWTIEFISEGCKNLTGYSPEQFMVSPTISWGSLIHPEDHKRVKDLVKEATEQNKRFHITYRILDIDKKVRWVRETGIGIERNGKEAFFLEGFIQDVTDIMEQGGSLEVADRALNAAGNGILVSDANKKGFPIIYVNKAFEKITGYSSGEAMGRNCNFLQSHDRDQEEIETIRRALAKGEACHVIIRNYKKDGTLFWNELSITPVKDHEGKLTHFIGIQNDVTHGKNMQLLRKAKNDILEMVVKKKSLISITTQILEVLKEWIKEGMFALMVMDEHKRTLHRMAGLSLPEALGSALDEILIGSNFCSCTQVAFHKKKEIVKDILDEPHWSKYHDIVKESDVSACWSYPMVDGNYDILGVLSVFHPKAVAPTKNEEELILEMVGLASLAFEQAKSQKLLNESHERLANYSKGLERKVEKHTKELQKALNDLTVSNFELVSQTAEAKEAEKRAETSEAMFLAIAKKFPKGAILLVDDKMYIHFMEGSELQSIQKQIRDNGGVKIADLKDFSEQRKEIFKRYIKRTLDGEHLSFETEYKRIPYVINTTPLSTENGNISHALLVLLNISDRKKNETKMLENLKRERELSELKSRFISTASHEFRTPLSVILSSATLIEKQNEVGQEERRLRHLMRIRSNVQHLVSILNDFLSLSKLDEGKTLAQPEYFDIIDLSKNIIEEIEVSKKAGQKITLDSNGAHISVYLDPKLMRHILLNLLSNAVKYSEENSPILLKIHDGLYEVFLTVEDKGIGIPIEEQQHLFQRFFRAKNSVNIAGTGLGLHIVKQYTELMNGKLNFTSEENKGSTFTLKFPKKVNSHEESISN